MRLCITGIGGFIGSALARRALARGDEVVGLDVSAPAAARAREAGATVVTGDTTDPAAAKAAVEGADVVIHTAALVREDGHLDTFRRINVCGPANMAWAAKDAGVGLFVHLSSVMVYGFDYPPDVTEDGPLDGGGNPYGVTKIEAERAVRAVEDRERGFGVIVIRPGDVYGPGSRPWVARPVELMRRRRFALPQGAGALNLVHVENLVDGILAAIGAGAAGDTFNLTDGVAVPCVDYFTRLAEAAAVPPPRVLPDGVARAIAVTIARAARLAGREPELGPETVRYVMRHHRISNVHARETLGWEPVVDLDAGLAALAEHLRAARP